RHTRSKRDWSSDVCSSDLSHVRYEADIFAHFQIVSYVVWGTAFILVLFVLLGGGGQEFGLLGTAFVSAALIYVMQEPLLNIVGRSEERRVGEECGGRWGGL